MVSKNIRKQNKVKQSKKNNKKLKGGYKSTNNKSLKKNNNKVMKGGNPTKKHKVRKLLKGGNPDNHKKQKKLSTKEKQQIHKLNSKLIEAYTNLETIKDINGNFIHMGELTFLVKKKMDTYEKIRFINDWIQDIENKKIRFLTPNEIDDSNYENEDDEPEVYEDKPIDWGTPPKTTTLTPPREPGIFNPLENN